MKRCCSPAAGWRSSRRTPGSRIPRRSTTRLLADAIHALAVEEQTVSEARRAVITILDTVQDELKRRYKDDPSLALH